MAGRTALLAMAGGPDEAAAAVRDGADLVDLGRAGPAEVEVFTRPHPGTGVCAASGPAALIRAGRFPLPQHPLPDGALWWCHHLAQAEAAVARGLARERVVVTAAPPDVAALAAAGWAVLVDADRSAAAVAAGTAGTAETAESAGAGVTAESAGVGVTAESAGAGETGRGLAGAGDVVPAVASVVAVAAVSSWLGAAIVATRQVRAVRRALDMTASIQGTRPPARALRGLA